MIPQVARKSVVVVEIGNDWLKVVGGTRVGQEGMITKVSFQRLVDIKEPVAAALVKVFKDLKLNKEKVIACMPRHMVTVRFLEFPATNPKDIQDMVSLQIGKQTPYSRDEIIFTYKTIATTNTGYTKVMLVIARRNLVNARIAVLQEAGIEIEKVALSSEGLAHWFCLAQDSVQADNKAVIYVDIDSGYSDFTVIRGGKLVYTRNFLIGANHLMGQEMSWQDKFCEETIHSMGLYLNEDRDVKIARLFLGGTAAHIPLSIVRLAQKVEVPIAVIEPLHAIPLQKASRLFEKNEGQLISPCPLIGIALAGSDLELDLTSSELHIKKNMEERRKQITTTGVLMLSILMALSTLFFISYFYKNHYMSELKKTIATMEKDALEVERMRTAINLVKGRLDARKSSINILQEITRLTPKEIYFTDIKIEEEKQTILQGRAAAMSNVFEFVTTLEGSPYFESVQTTYTTTKKEKDTEHARFEIICIHEKHDDDFGS